MKRNALIIGTVCVALVVAAVSWSRYWRFLYPHGTRTAFLPCMLMALQCYASEHSGCFPKGGRTPLDSLKLLYPQSGDPCILAGISGDIGQLQARIATNGVIDDSVSSWVYIPGLRSDDKGDVAVIWEREGGVTFNGRRVEAGSHAVGFAAGYWQQIPARDWASFQRSQTELRAAILSNRTELND